MNKIYHIDCTLRDGGYYNSWNFNDKVVKKYLEAMSNLDIDYVEFGFRFLKDTSNLGPFASTSDKLINKYKIPKELKIAVMINIGEFSMENLKIDLDKLFLNSKKSKVKLVRIASHKNEIEIAIQAAKILKKKGYFVAINLMQISEININSLSKILKKFEGKFLDCFYFADSLGSLSVDKTKKICQTIKKNWNGPFGIHAHDNTEIALHNTIISLKNGASYVDSTVLGMGRGPGNVKTELLCSYLNFTKLKKNNLIFLTDIVDKYFSALKKKYMWGTNLYYYLSANHRIHPTYIQNMLSDERYEDNEMILAIENLKKQKCKLFNPTVLKNSKKFFNYTKFEKVDKRFVNNRKILILGNSNSLVEFNKRIISYINKNKPVVISLNYIKNQHIAKKIDYLAICHPTRILTEIKSIPKDMKLITPYSCLQSDLKNILKNYSKINYGLVLDDKNFKIEENYCVLNKALVLSYILSFLTSSNVNSISFAGLDGYVNNSFLRKENNKILSKFKGLNPRKKFNFLTPTLYRI